MLLSGIGTVSLRWKKSSITARVGLIIGIVIILVAMIGVMWLWKISERWWDHYWGSFKCKKCRKRFDDRWQTEWGICWYCKNGKTIKVEINRPKAEPRVVKLFTCPECQLVLKTDMKDENGKCKLCNEL